ncbi:MAG: 6,7-dimethyl-8-ribityllumazine synthase [Bacteroidota bacterium]
MISSKKNLSVYDTKTIPSSQKIKFGIVVSEWNKDITDALYNGAFETLITNGAKKENIITKYVPGSFELPLGAQFFAKNSKVDAIICIGCVIQGETRHFEFISNAVSKGIMDVNLKYNLPVIFCVLTPNDHSQAKERAGGKYGNKGVEAAITAIKMAALGLGD